MATEPVKVSGGFYIMLALMLLLVPLQWLFASLFAAAFHELCHYLAIRICCKKLDGWKLYSFATHLSLPQMSRGREALCALAGPLGSLCMLPLAPVFPRLAVCAAMQCAYNLLPIYPLDGGRVLQCGLLMFLPPPKANAICAIMEMLCKVFIIILALYGCICLRLGIFPLLMALLLLIRVK